MSIVTHGKVCVYWVLFPAGVRYMLLPPAMVLVLAA
jgi:hypothetical protein